MKHELKKEKDFYLINLHHEGEEIERAFTKEYANIAKKLKLNGFRPGKVPVAIAKNFIKIDEIKEKVIHNLIKEEIDLLSIEEEKYDDIEIEIKNFEYKKELISEVKYYLYPKIKLQDNYLEKIKTIELKKTEEIVTEEEVQKEIEKFQNENLDYEEVEAIKSDNLILIGDFKAVDYETKEILIDEKEYQLIINDKNRDKLLEKKLFECEKNIESKFEIEYSLDYPITHLQNKKIEYTIFITKITEGKKIEITKELLMEALELDEKDERTINEIIRDNILERKKEVTDKNNYEKIIDCLLEISEFEISEYVIENEKEKIFKDFKEKNELDEKMLISEFANMIEKDITETENDFKEIAKNKIMSYLIINEINSKENIYEEKAEDNLESLLEGFNEAPKEDILFSLFKEINEMGLNNRNEFSISKENINKVIKFLIDKINQESNTES